MKFWPWARPEIRSSSYTDQAIAQLLASASGASDGSALAAIETAARWWGLGLSSATVTPSNLATKAITPSVLDTIGRIACAAVAKVVACHRRARWPRDVDPYRVMDSSRRQLTLPVGCISLP